MNPAPDFQLDDDARRELHRIAAASIKALVRGEAAPRIDLTAPLTEPAGAFVSVHRHGELRGCMGRVLPEKPLGETVLLMAAAAASRDPRFSPIEARELDDIDIELSVLTPPQRIRADDIEPGRHGLLVRRGNERGLLLPQVASSRGWDAETFLRQTCRKAGLPEDAWRDPAAELYAFEAIVF